MFKSLREIEKEIATECGEEHFEVQLSAEIGVGAYKEARRLLMEVVDRYMAQHTACEDEYNTNAFPPSELSTYKNFVKDLIGTPEFDLIEKEWQKQKTNEK